MQQSIRFNFSIDPSVKIVFVKLPFYVPLSIDSSIMDDVDNQLEDIGRQSESEFFDQSKIDDTNMKNLNIANRAYRKCLRGKCPPVDQTKKPAVLLRRRKKHLKTQQYRDFQLAKVWKEIGRNNRMKNLEKEVQELRTKIAVAESKVHVVEQEKNFKIIKEKIKEIEMLDAVTSKANFEIQNLKSQIVRVRAKREEISRQAESEGKMMSCWSL